MAIVISPERLAEIESSPRDAMVMRAEARVLCRDYKALRVALELLNRVEIFENSADRSAAIDLLRDYGMALPSIVLSKAIG